LDLTNGSRGEIVDIILHPEEPPIGNNPIVILKYIPLYVLVKLERTRASTLEGLQDGVIPIEPVTSTFRVKMTSDEGKTSYQTIRRKQFPIAAGYAFTDYRAQGQTLSFVIVDIATPPTGTLTLFNLYVALSRSRGRASIRLLRDFDDKLFRGTHNPALLTEDERLEDLNKKAEVWYNNVCRRQRK
jgi:hypothetical protein